MSRNECNLSHIVYRNLRFFLKFAAMQKSASVTVTDTVCNYSIIEFLLQISTDIRSSICFWTFIENVCDTKISAHIP